MRILFTGGGTGGHIFPIVAVVRELKRLAEEQYIVNLKLFYMGPNDRGHDDLAAEQVMTIRVKSGKMRRYHSFRNIADMFTFALGVLQAIWNMFWIMPDIVFSKGGQGALPVVVAAIIFRIPLVVHESDAVPGRVNRFSARFAARIGIAFAGAADYFPKGKTALVGVPIRKYVLGGSRDEARNTLSVFSAQPAVGILGGSQGAQKLNEAIIAILKELTDEFEVLHQTGENNFEDVREETSVILEFAHKERYHEFGFLEESPLRDFYAAADLIVSRAGSSIFEIAAHGKPSILVPLSHAAQDHQRKNAAEYAVRGAAVVVEEGNLSPHVLLAEIRKLLADPMRLAKMGESAKLFAHADSAELIAVELLKIGVH